MKEGNLMYRPTYMKIDLSLLEDNCRYLSAKANKELIPVIKANAYGMGDVEVALKLQSIGIKLIAVSSLDEAIHLRSNNINMDILILGYVDSHDFNLVRNNNLIILTVSLDYVMEHNFKNIKVHLKIDSGMGRIGLRNLKEAKKALDILFKSGARIEGIMTHFAKSDEEDEKYTIQQFNKFKSIVEGLNYNFKYIHAANTDAIINFDEDFTNAIRSGLGCFGYSSFESDLKPIASLYTKVINIKQVDQGSGIGYGQKYHAENVEFIATMPIGYADGFLRNNCKGQFYSEGAYFDIVGNICMDQLMVRVNDQTKMLQEFEIFGEHISAYLWADRCQMIIYEFLTTLSDRITRLYYDEGVLIKEITPRFKRD